MARLSDDFFRFSEHTFTTFGFKNKHLLSAFIIAGTLSLFAVTGSYLPALASLVGGLMTLIVGGGAFLGISLFTDFSIVGMIFGVIAGIILASITSFICSLMLFLAPIAATLLHAWLGQREKGV